MLLFSRSRTCTTCLSLDLEVQQWKKRCERLETIIVEKDELLESLQEAIKSHSGSFPIDAQNGTSVNTIRNEREIKVEYIEAEDPFESAKENSTNTEALIIMNEPAGEFKENDEITYIENGVLKRKYRTYSLPCA